jgi:hypothetical protein
VIDSLKEGEHVETTAADVAQGATIRYAADALPFLSTAL